ncbi:uncharacterized protein LOC106666732 isoform X2 [Cimex lectularius]|uniref:Uncharacterized protein n=1 Tax=Cimex lectularius TaxID=79782 RepID=A0A8I6RQI6_CIMLE|nr:uncharacterized protein LOC106666732 isoform X2 [Cimex lectularius]
MIVGCTTKCCNACIKAEQGKKYLVRSEPVTYRDEVDEIDYTLITSKFRSLSDFQKLHAMQNVREVVDRKSGGFPLISALFNSGFFPIQSGNPLSQLLANDWRVRPNTIRRPVPSACPARVEDWRKFCKPFLKIDLGVFPVPDFRFSRDVSHLPEHYRVEREPINPPRLYCPAPINVVIGNLSILNHTSNVQNFFTSTTGIYSSQQAQPQTYTYCFDQHLALKANNYF